MKRYFLMPLALFLILEVFLAVGLNRDPREVPSPPVGKPTPSFSLPRLDAGPEAAAQATSFNPKDMAGKVQGPAAMRPLLAALALAIAGFAARAGVASPLAEDTTVDQRLLWGGQFVLLAVSVPELVLLVRRRGNTRVALTPEEQREPTALLGEGQR